MKINDKVLETLGVSIKDTPMLFITQVDSIRMAVLSKFKTESDSNLKNLRDHYAITSVEGYERYKSLLIYDILTREIEDPHDISYYIHKKREYQTMCKYIPNIVRTFFYHPCEENNIEQKIKNAISFTFKSFKDEKINVDDGLIISTTYGNQSNFHMERLIDKVIHTHFVVISEIINNELSKKYYFIKEKENNEDDSDAD